VPNSRYFRDLAAMYREIARQANDPHAADSMSGIAALHQETADELEQWSEPFARSPIVPETEGDTSPCTLKRSKTSRLALQLLYLKASESMGNHDSKVVDADSVD
jgi:hypothetical protein